MSEEQSSNNRKAVYTIIESTNGGKSRWIRLGIAFVNRDGSLNVMLDALPVSGELHIRDFPSREEADAGESPPATTTTGRRPRARSAA